MRNKSFILGLIFILSFVMGISAQEKKADYSGVWELNVAESELNEFSLIEAMILTVTQTEKKLSIKREVEMGEPPSNSSARRVSLTAKDGEDAGENYNLDGTEIESELKGEMADGTRTRLAGFDDDDNLILTTTMNLNFQGREINSTMKETWELSGEGKTLTVKREIETPNGTRTSKLVFAKK